MFGFSAIEGAVIIPQLDVAIIVHPQLFKDKGTYMSYGDTVCRCCVSVH